MISEPSATSLSSQMSSVESCIAADAARLRRLQQRVALLEHAVVVGEHAGEARRALHEQLVEEAPARRTGRRGRSAGLRERTARPARSAAARRSSTGAPLTRALFAPCRFSCTSSSTLPLAVREPRPDDRGIRAVAHHRRIVRDPVRAEGREVGDRLDEIRLALTVAADEHVRAGAERDVGDRIVAEVDETQLLHDHWCNPSSRPTSVRVCRTACCSPSGRRPRVRVSAAAGSAAAGT